MNKSGDPKPDSNESPEEVSDMVICGEEYKPYDNIRKGMDGERLVSRVLEALRIPHSHNPFDRTYGTFMGHGSDVEGSGPLKGQVQIEVKNLNGRWRITKAWIMREVINRFTPGCKNKILVLFGGNFISQPLRDLIKSCGIRLVELDQQVTGYSRAMFRDLLNKLMYLKYLFKSKLREFFSSINSKFNNKFHSNFNIKHMGVNVLLGNIVYTPPRNKVDFGSRYVKIKTVDPVQRKIIGWGDVLS